MDLQVFSFTGIYQEQDFWREPADDSQGSRFFDLSGLSGTRGYLSDEACKALTDLLSRSPRDRQILRFIDSGNYHYVTRLLTDRIGQDFALVLFDHHPDMQQPAFGGLLSCGSWVRSALNVNSHLRMVWLLGVDKALAEEALADDPGEWAPCESLTGTFCRKWDGRQLYLVPELPEGRPALNLFLEEILNRTPFPLYLSVDKDVLSPDDVHTDWDQGTLPAASLYEALRFFTSRVRLLGADICGECDVSFSTPLRYRKENDQCNANLLDIFRNAL